VKASRLSSRFPVERGDRVVLAVGVVVATPLRPNSSHIRPLRLIVDLHDVNDLDPINVGTLAATCYLGDDHQVAVFLDYAGSVIAGQLTAAGVPRHRLRHVNAQRPPDRTPHLPGVAPRRCHAPEVSRQRDDSAFAGSCSTGERSLNAE
jgi:hypothetical protein